MKTPAKPSEKAVAKPKAATKAKTDTGAAAKPKKTAKAKRVLPKLSPVDQALQNHLIFSSFKTNDAATPRDWYDAASYTVRDHVVARWIKTAEAYYEKDPKRVYYLSLEFLMGRMLSNAALNLGIQDELERRLGKFRPRAGKYRRDGDRCGTGQWWLRSFGSLFC